MKRRTIFIFVAAAIIAAAGVLALRIAGQTEEKLARQALSGFLDQAKTATYTGTVVTSVFADGREDKSVAVVKHCSAGERIEYPNGVVVVSTGTETRTYHPDTGKVQVVPGPREKTTGWSTNYSPRHISDGSVAGRKVMVFDLASVHAGNPSKRLWIDQDTGVILQNEQHDCCGRLRSRTKFQRIDYVDKLPSSILDHPKRGKNVPWRYVSATISEGNDIHQIEKTVGIKLALPKFVPMGYRLAGIALQPCPCCTDRKVAHIRYSDGINSISIYEMATDHPCGKSCRTTCAAGEKCEVMSAGQASVAATSRNGRDIIVVADLSQKQLKKIAESIN